MRFEQDYLNGRTVMEISAIDMPGLLSVIANVIAEKDIDITHALFEIVKHVHAECAGLGR